MFLKLLPFLIGTIVVLILLLVGFLIFLSQKNKSSKKNEESKDESKDTSQSKLKDSLELKNSFFEGFQTLKKNLPNSDYLYKIPWFLIIGQSSSGKSSILENIEHQSLSTDKDETKKYRKKSVHWGFFNEGVILEPSGDVIFEQDGKFNEETFYTLLKLLKKVRPDLPINGIILTVPVSDFLLSEGEVEDQLRTRIVSKSEEFYSRLSKIQMEFGMQLPIYVILTKTDYIPGFKSYCKALPDSMTSEIIGWSNPNAIDAVYHENWSQEAMKSIQEGIFYSQMELFTQNENIEGVEKLFFFVKHFEKLSFSLHYFMQILFKKSSYHASFFLRGLYFTGSCVSNEAEENKPIFIKDLFEKKIFLEKGLAKMVEKTVISKHQKVYLLQVATASILLIGSVGLIQAYFYLKEQKENLQPTFQLAAKSLSEVQNRKTIDPTLFKEKVSRLIHEVTKIEPSAFSSWFIPISWNSELQEKMLRVMTVTYEQIIIKIMRIVLDSKAKSFGFEELKQVPEQEMIQEIKWNYNSLEQLKEFADLYEFVREMETLEKHIQLYNQLVQGNANPQDFSQLVKYIYNLELNSFVPKETLEKLSGTVIEKEILQYNATAKLWNLTQAFYQQIFEKNILDQKLIELEQELKKIVYTKPTDESNLQVVQFQIIQDILKEIQNILENDQMLWIGQSKLNLGSKYESILNTIRDSSLFEKKVYEELQQLSNIQFKNLQEVLMTRTSKLTGTFLTYDTKEANLKLSKPVKEFKIALEDYFTLEFASIELDKPKYETKPLASLSNSKIFWNTAFLEQAVDLYTPYQSFITERLNNFPKNLQSIFQQVSSQSLEINMLSLIYQAQRIEAVPITETLTTKKEKLRIHILNFKEASNHLNKLLTIFDQLKFLDSSQKVFQTIITQTNSILEEIDEILKKEELYIMQEGNFAWWNGEKNISFISYNVSDSEEMKYYLKKQKEQITFLAFEYAKPILDFLEGKVLFRGNIRSNLLEKWKRVLLVLEQHEQKKPGNSLDVLEKFISVELDQVVQNNCLTSMNREVLKRRSQDFFLETKNTIEKQLYLRCQYLENQQTINEY